MVQLLLNHFRVKANCIQKLGEIVFFETTDRRKATKILYRKQGIIYCSPNLPELRAMAKFLSPDTNLDETNDLNEILVLSEIVSKAIDFIIVTMGAKGIVTIKNSKYCESSETLVAKYYPVEALSQIENVSGAGDCFASGFIYGMLCGYDDSRNVCIGFQSAKQALFCKSTIPQDLHLDTNVIKPDYVTYKIKGN